MLTEEMCYLIQLLKERNPIGSRPWSKELASPSGQEAEDALERKGGVDIYCFCCSALTPLLLDPYLSLLQGITPPLFSMMCFKQD